MKQARDRRGQSTFELALMIVVVVAAVIAMSIFMKRSVMGKLRESGDQIGGQFTPLSVTSTYKTTVKGTRDDNLDFSGFAEQKNLSETRDRTGKEHVTATLDSEKLGLE